MATAAIAGYDGSVSGPSGVSEVTQWEIDLTVDSVDATSFDSNGWHEFIAGLQGANGSFTAIGSPPATGAASSATFKTKSTGGKSISGDIIVTSVKYTTPVEGRVEYAATFQFTGEVTVADT